MNYKLPEATDVWDYKGKKLFITSVNKEEYGYVSFMDNNDFHHCTISLFDFKRLTEKGVLKYIDKSIVNINQLFQTFDKNNIIISLDNTTVEFLKILLMSSRPIIKMYIENDKKGLLKDDAIMLLNSINEMLK